MSFEFQASIFIDSTAEFQAQKQRSVKVQKDIHPEYQTVIFLDTSCDYKILSRSTMKSKETMEWEDGNSYPVIRVEISSASHPFYTGKRQQIMDRGGRIEQFNRRYGKSMQA